MLAAGRVLAEELDIDLVHGHDWLVAVARKRLADEARVPFVTTIHATEYGRHQGWVHQPPMSDIHRTERWMAHSADQVIVCSHYMRGHVADIYDLEGGPGRRDPERDRPRRPRGRSTTSTP